MNNNNFIESINNFSDDFSKVSSIEDEILKHKEKLKENLEKLLQSSTFSISEKNNLLLNSINDLKASTKSNISSWNKKSSDLLPMKALSEQYADRIIFLVFGKVNAGKSSFANFITDLFPSDQVKRFCFEDGKIHYFQDDRNFAEGVTETTATIQGVELGENFVLLDSPGLHSVTHENGALTQKFIDSTDAVLWLTPSTSPGQVQELNDLKVELEKGKPLQPVITRSDYTEEDEHPETGELVGILKNKTSDNRKLQEQDVLKRIDDTELTIPVKNPVSISVRAYKEGGKTQSALDEAGLTTLLTKMAELIDEAKTYKVGKANKQMVNFLEKDILTPLNQEIKPKIDRLINISKENADELKRKKEYLISMLMGEIVSEIPSIVNKHTQTQDKNAIASELSLLINSQVNAVLKQELSAFISDVETISHSLSEDSIGNFEDITIDITQVKGSGWKAASSGLGIVGGSLGGAALGSMIFPFVGTFIGGSIGAIVGGMAGSAVGDEFIETEVIQEKIGVSTNQLISKTTKSVKEALPSMIDTIINDAVNSIRSVEQFAKAIAKEIDQFSDEIQTIKATKL